MDLLFNMKAKALVFAGKIEELKKELFMNPDLIHKMSEKTINSLVDLAIERQETKIISRELVELKYLKNERFPLSRKIIL